ncbi:Chromatin assembly factor 1 subunit B [Kappamyces sp. JEL0680]|nr:Chromatin assembly factor 1 subunit B [Kappamyces sp. JEL0680]
MKEAENAVPEEDAAMPIDRAMEAEPGLASEPPAPTEDVVMVQPCVPETDTPTLAADGTVDDLEESAERNRRTRLRDTGRKNYEESSDDDDIEGFLNRVSAGVKTKKTSSSPRKSSKQTMPPRKPSKPLSYRFVFAVATLDSVTIYSTQRSHARAIAHLTNLHYAPLTDVAWSADGSFLLLSSTDGFCTIVKFEGDELGVPVQETIAPCEVVARQSAPMAAKDAEMVAPSALQSAQEPDSLMEPIAASQPATMVPSDLAPSASHLDENTAKKKRIQPTFIRNI